MIKKTLATLLFSLVLGAPVLCEDQVAPVGNACAMGGCGLDAGDASIFAQPLGYFAVRVSIFLRQAAAEIARFECEYPGLIDLRASKFYYDMGAALDAMGDDKAAQKAFVNARVSSTYLQNYFFVPITPEEALELKELNAKNESMIKMIEECWRNSGNATPSTDAAA